MRFVVEVCVDSLQSALAAEDGGADRIELCSSLIEGGITPSHGTIAAVCSKLAPTRTKVHVLIRPRPGDFIYNNDELEIMKADILHAVSCGAHGVVLGLLTPQSTIDTDRLKFFVELCLALRIELTFHRAFDVVRDQMLALNDLISCGVRRVLTSGGARKAMEGLERIAALVKEGQGRISIMPGGGLNEDNIIPVLRYTSAVEVHGTFRMMEATTMRWIHPVVHFSPEAFQDHKDSYSAFEGREGQGDACHWNTHVTDAEVVKRVNLALRAEEEDAAEDMG